MVTPSREPNINPGTVELYNLLMHERLDARALTGLLRAPDFKRDLTGTDWEHYIPTSMREGWSTCSWEVRVGAYVVAWMAAAEALGVDVDEN
jgi:hypothetical protein